jgi:uncharacterized protein (TIGR02646 family)
MIRIIKKSIPPEILQTKAENLRIKALKECKKHKFYSRYYGHPSVKKKLLEIYCNKCAYCESSISEGAALQVEHYRPKKNLMEDMNHPGYYWLAYEWTNLLLSCPSCNRSKSNSFPIMGERVKSPQNDHKEWHINSESFISEKPLLINPEFDNLEKQFKFYIDGSIAGEDKNRRSEETIRICNLNRENLRAARKEEIETFISEILDIEHKVYVILNYLKNNNDLTRDNFHNVIELEFNPLFQKLMKAMQKEHKYACLWRYIFNNFKEFIIKQFSRKEYQDMVYYAFNRYFSNKKIEME